MKNKELAQDIKIIKEYYDTPYPPYLHDIDLYDSVDFFTTLCMIFLKKKNKNLEYKFDVFAGVDIAELEHKMLLIDSKELNEYYAKMKNTIRILKKYYNEDGTLKKSLK